MRAAVPMTRDVVVVPPELSLASAWSLMEHRRIRHLPVVRAGALVGIVSDRDILLRATLGEHGSVQLAGTGIIAEAMTPTPVTCEPSTPVAELARIMTERKIDAVPVVRGLHLIGLVTSTDLLALLIDHDEARPLPFEFRLVDHAHAHAIHGSA